MLARAASVVSCASAAERNWSVYGKIKTETRSRIGHAVADKLVYGHEALHLKQTKQKFQSASLRAKGRVAASWTPTPTRDSDARLRRREKDLAQ